MGAEQRGKVDLPQQRGKSGKSQARIQRGAGVRLRTKEKKNVVKAFFCRIELEPRPPPPPPPAKIPGSVHESSLSGEAWKKKSSRSKMEKVDTAQQRGKRIHSGASWKR